MCKENTSDRPNLLCKEKSFSFLKHNLLLNSKDGCMKQSWTHKFLKWQLQTFCFYYTIICLNIRNKLFTYWTSTSLSNNFTKDSENVVVETIIYLLMVSITAHERLLSSQKSNDIYVIQLGELVFYTKI